MDQESALNQTSDLPVELMGPTPRKVRMTWVGWANVFLSAFFIIVGVAFGAALVKKVVHDTAVQDALRQGGSDSSGQVTSRLAATRWSGWKVSYTFAANGAFYSGKSNVPKETWNRLRQNDSLPIRFLPSDPNVNHPAGWEEPTFSLLWAVVIPAGMALVGLLLVRRIPFQRRLAVEGIAVRGCVTDWHRRSSAKFTLDYTFRIENSGQAETGSCPSDRSRRIGSDVWILYLPGNPSRSEIYPFNDDLFRIDP
jgi:hypothetical protein